MGSAKIIPGGKYPHQKIYNYHKPVPKKDWPKREVPIMHSGADLKKEELDYDACVFCGGKGTVWKQISSRRSRQMPCECASGDAN